MDEGACIEAIGTAGSAEKVALAKQAGYAHVINYTEDDFVQQVMDITNGAGVSVVYDSVGKDTYPGSLKCLQTFGKFISFGQSSGLADFKLGDLAANGSLYAQRPTLASYIATAEQLAEMSQNLFAMLESGKLSVSINQRFNLSDTADAFRALTSRQTKGVTLIDV